MQTVSLELDYDFNTGDYTAEAIDALAALTDLAGDHVSGAPQLHIHTVVANADGVVSFNITTAQQDSEADPFDWLVDATDAVMPVEATEADITLSFQLDDTQAVLLKAAWPAKLPRLNVEVAA